MDLPVVSYSSLDTYSKCPYCYYLKYIVHESQDEADFTGAVPGNVSHKLAEQFFEFKNKAGIVDWEIFNANFEAVFKKYIKSPNVYLHKEAFAASIPEARIKIKNWTENLVDMLKQHNIVKPVTISEFRFGSYKNPLRLTDKLLFTGGPDIFSSESMTTPGVLVDYKASESSFHINEKQIFLYALALKKDLGVDVSMAGFFLFKSREAVWKRVSKERLSETIAWAESIVDNIMKENFDASPSKSACNLCPFKKICEHSSFKEFRNTSIKSVKQLQSENINFVLPDTPEL